jgi:hypothetical protein
LQLAAMTALFWRTCATVSLVSSLPEYWIVSRVTQGTYALAVPVVGIAVDWHAVSSVSSALRSGNTVNELFIGFQPFFEFGVGSALQI